MNYKYSICHPNKEEIEYKNDLISEKEVINIAKNYPWLEQLKLMATNDKIFYNPSLDFKCVENGKSFALTAELNKSNQLEFSLWYNRPKKIKVLFGLFGETEKMVVSDIWHFNFDNAIKYIELFVNGNYQILEELYKK